MITEKARLETVSIVIPVYNEEKYIKQLVNSLLNQKYDRSKIEIIFVDGNSQDNTVDSINSLLQKNNNINYKILYNPKKIPPISVNIGIKEAKNDIIIRLDAHSEYPSNYIEKCVYYINNIDADNVGCLVLAKGRTFIQNAIANVVSSKFGVGNSSFRTNAKSGYVDTVPFGTFRRELFSKIGYFNEELPRSEDNEFNNRIIKNGGKVYLFNDVIVTYYPRDSIIKLIKMGFTNGKWGLYTSYLIPGSMKLRHFIPMIFVLGIIIGAIIVLISMNKILFWIYISVIVLYCLLDILFTIKGVISGGIKQIICFLLYPIFHFSYGVGSICGIGKIIKKVVKK